MRAMSADADAVHVGRFGFLGFELWLGSCWSDVVVNLLADIRDLRDRRRLAVARGARKRRLFE